MTSLWLPDDWTPEQANAAADLLYSAYLQLMDALYEQYPAATQPYRLPGELLERSGTQEVTNPLTGASMESEDVPR